MRRCTTLELKDGEYLTSFAIGYTRGETVTQVTYFTSDGSYAIIGEGADES